MVKAKVVLDSSGGLYELSLVGHAERFTGEKNHVCAAISLLVRSVACLLSERSGWIVDGGAERPGNLSLTVRKIPPGMEQWLLGVTDTLLKALSDIGGEYPSSLSVSIEELKNGT